MKEPMILGSRIIFSDGPEVVMTREQLAAHVAAARAEGMREAARIVVETCHDDMTREEEATAILSAIGERQ